MDRSKWILAMGIVAMMLAVGASLFVYDTQADDVISLDSDTTVYDENKKSYSIGTLQGLKNFASLVNNEKTLW